MLQELLREQDGVLTLEQARKVGISKDGAKRRVRSGEWERCTRGVYFVRDRPFGDAARIRAAILAHGDRAVASGLTAAWWLDLTKFAPAVVEVTVPRDSNGRAHPGCRVRRRDLDPRDVIERKGLRVTAPPLTAVEAATRRGGGIKLMDNALQRRIELSALWAAHLRNTGRYGSPAARRLLRTAEGGAKSEAERIFKRLLTEAGVAGWKANQMVAGYEVDFLFEAAKLVVEIDGLAFHTDAETFRRDRIKQNAIVTVGHQVLRFTWVDLTEYPGRSIALVEHATSA